jgi:hypothetical protein
MSSYVRYYRQPTIQQWAQNSLNENELVNFLAAIEENNNLWNQYKVNGYISIEPIYENVTMSISTEPVQIQIGEKVILNTNISESDLKMADSYKPWLDRFYQENGADPVQFVANIA